MERKVTVQDAFEKISKKCGSTDIRKIEQLPKVKDNIVSTGIIGLDKILGIGGIRKGSIVEIYAPESSGKTTLALQLCKQFQKENQPVLYIDTERTLTPETIKCMGVKDKDFYLTNESVLEKVLEICKLSAPAFGLIVIDSLAGLVPKAQLEGDVGDCHTGLFTRTMSQTLPMLIPVLMENECTLVITTQIREKINVLFGNPETTIGGRALKYYASVRLDMRRTETIKQAGNYVGCRTRIKVVKNKMAAPSKETEVDIIYGSGISEESNLLDEAMEYGVINKCGLQYLYNGELLGTHKESTVAYLKENPKKADKIKKEVLKLME